MATTDLLPPWLRVSMQAGGAVLIVVAGPAFYVATRDATGAGLVLAAGAAALLLSRIDMIEQFAAWGLSAKLREAKAAADRATMSAEEIRRLALPLTRMALGIAMGSGRWGGTGNLRVSADEQARRMLDLLNATGAERMEVYREWTAFVLFDRAHRAYEAIRRAADAEKHKALSPAGKVLYGIGPDGPWAAPASRFEELALANGALSSEAAHLIATLAEGQGRVAGGSPLDGPPPVDADD